MTAKVRDMTLLIKTLTAVAAGTMLATSAFAQSAREFRGPSPFETSPLVYSPSRTSPLPN